MKCKTYSVDKDYEINGVNENKIIMAILLSLKKRNLLTYEQVNKCKKIIDIDNYKMMTTDI